MFGRPVSIIIPNYNGEPILGDTLSSVEAAVHAYPGNSEIIVVDDASQDGSIQLITGNYPEIRVVRHHENKGFAEAVHSGVNASIYEIVILLNSDVRPHSDFIEPLVKELPMDYLRTERRTRALEEFLLPELRAREKQIEERLDEIEREEAVSLRWFRARRD